MWKNVCGRVRLGHMAGTRKTTTNSLSKEERDKLILSMTALVKWHARGDEDKQQFLWQYIIRAAELFDPTKNFKNYAGWWIKAGKVHWAKLISRKKNQLLENAVRLDRQVDGDPDGSNQGKTNHDLFGYDYDWGALDDLIVLKKVLKDNPFLVNVNASKQAKQQYTKRWVERSKKLLRVA